MLSKSEERLQTLTKMMDKLQATSKQLFIERDRLIRKKLGRAYKFQNSHEHT